MVASAKPFPLIYDDLCEFFLGETTMFAHNCSFDKGIILHELQRMGMEYNFPWPMHHICTVEKSFPIKNKRLKLDHLYQIATGRERHRKSHRAEDDVLDMIECIQFLKENDFL
jgi:DNA polymerase III epsilon subunit-like protein